MTDLAGADVHWIVDPVGDYTPGRGPEIVAWLDAWGRPFSPSSRYYTIKRLGDMIWAGYKFHIGLETEADADAFIAKWGGFKAPGFVSIDKKFHTIPANAWEIFFGILPRKKIVKFSPEHDRAYGGYL